MLLVQHLVNMRIKTLSKKIKEICSILTNITRGTIVIAHRSDGTRFFQSINGKKKYLNKNDQPTIISLARKYYYTRLQKELMKQNANLKEALNLIKKAEEAPTAEEIYNSLPEEIKALTKINELDNNFAKEWQALKYIRKSVPQELPFYSAKNEHVRSKSELIIANALKEQNIPYHYECPLDLEDQTIHPDFTILNKRTREIYIWEHFGMLDDKEYSIKALKKLELYITNNYLPNKNLIITYETSVAPLSTQTVENKIAEFLK